MTLEPLSELLPAVVAELAHHNPGRTPMTDHRQRVAIVVFADVDSNISDAHHVAERALRNLIGRMDGETHTVRIGGREDAPEIGVRFHDVMEAGMAAGNGYLWTQVTPKAFRQYEWQFAGEDAEQEDGAA